jgi:hypothetical protein
MKQTSIWLSALALSAGTPAILGSQAPADHVVVLPPFLVEEPSTSGPAWIYGEADGIEVLSGCYLEETQQLVQEIREQRFEINQFIPDEFLLRTKLPTTLIIFPESFKQTMDQAVVQEVEKTPDTSSAPDRFNPTKDLRLSDPDSSYIFIFLDDWEWKANSWKRGVGQLHQSDRRRHASLRVDDLQGAQHVGNRAGTL